jgi:hypothetical protein
MKKTNHDRVRKQLSLDIRTVQVLTPADLVRASGGNTMDGGACYKAYCPTTSGH